MTENPYKPDDAKPGASFWGKGWPRLLGIVIAIAVLTYFENKSPGSVLWYLRD